MPDLELDHTLYDGLDRHELIGIIKRACVRIMETEIALEMALAMRETTEAGTIH